MKRQMIVIAMTSLLLIMAIIVGVIVISQEEEQTVTLVIWHDLGKNGDRWLQEVAQSYQSINPNVQIEPVSLSTQQWNDKAITSIKAGSPPDLLFNNYERIIRVEEQTGGIANLMTLPDGLSPINYGGKSIIIPVQQVQMAFGVRKSWLKNLGLEFPTTWAKTLEIARAFTEDDPDQNGKDDTYGFALEGYKPRDLIHMLDLFTLGTGIPHTVIDGNGDIVITDFKNEAVTSAFYGLMGSAYTPAETIYYGFTEMYQIIESGKAGMFRVGDWNVAKWDVVLDGDYEVGPWPSFTGGQGNVVIGGVRGVSIPMDSSNLEAAKSFAIYLTSQEAQIASFKNVGSCLIKNLALNINQDLTQHQLFFATHDYSTSTYDFPDMTYRFYSDLESAYHQALVAGLKQSRKDVDAILRETEVEMMRIIEEYR